MRLFTKDIDKQLFAQYPKGGDLENQKVVAKIFNPFGNGTWYLINSDPNDPNYLWAIVDLFEVEVGSVSRMDLETIKVPPFRLGLERDMSFTPINAQELFDGLLQGKHFAKGGSIADSNKEMLLNQAEEFEHHAEEFESAVEKADEIPAWVVAKSQRASTDLSDITHYLDGENEQNREMEEGEEYAKGGEFGVGKHRVYFSSFAEVMDAINDIANENGYDVVDIFPDLSYGGVGYGQTKRAKVELEWNGKDKMGKSKKRDKNTLNVQIYRMDSGNYELNTYFSYAHGGMTDDNVIETYKGYSIVDTNGVIEVVKGDSRFIIGLDDSKMSGSRKSVEMNRDEELKSAHDYIDWVTKNKMAMGGETFDSKVKSIKSRLLENNKVSPKVQKDYGKTYSPKEAEDSAKRIVGAMTAAERLKAKRKSKKK